MLKPVQSIELSTFIKALDELPAPKLGGFIAVPPTLNQKGNLIWILIVK